MYISVAERGKPSLAPLLIVTNFFIIKPTRCTSFPNLLRHETAFEQGQDIPSWPCSNAVYKPVLHIPAPSVQWINSWWWAEELPETSRISWRSKFGKLVYLFGFIINKFVTMQHGHMSRCTVTCHDAARSHVTMHGHMSRCSTVTWK